MYGLNEIVAMNGFADLSHKDRVSSEGLAIFNRAVINATEILLAGHRDPITRGEWEARINAAKILLVGHRDPFTHGEWEERQQKEREHQSASNTNNQHKGE